MITTVKKSLPLVALWLAMGSGAQLFGAFGTRVDLPGAFGVCHYVATADLDKDGLVDAVATDDSNGVLMWIRQTSPGTFTPTVIDNTLGGQAAEVSIADMNGDCNLDIVVNAGGALTWYQSSGGTSPTFTKVVLSSLSVQGCVNENHTVVDIDGDGDLDIVVSFLSAPPCPGLGGLWLFSNDGVGGFTPSYLGNFGIAGTFGAADFDHDGDIDLAATGFSDAYWIENTGTPTSPAFTTIHYLKTGNFYGVRVKDLDRDCNADILLNTVDDGSGNGELRWFQNNGSALFTESLLASGPDMRFWNNIVVKDFNGDGHLDIVGGGTGGASSGFTLPRSDVIFLQNNGSQVFTKFTIDTLYDSESFAVADLNADCKPDVLAAGFSQNAVSYWFNTFNFGCLCPAGGGYWKKHLCLWPESSLTLGKKTYTQAELVAILSKPPGNDASLQLARELIAAKLSIASGSDPAPIGGTMASGTIPSADSLLCTFSGKLPYNVSTSSSVGGQMTSLKNTLANYNSGALTLNCVPR